MRRAGLQHFAIRWAVLDLLERAFEFRLGGALIVGFEGRLVAPAFDDDEAIGAARLRQDRELQIGAFAAALVAIFLDEFKALRHGARTDIEISHGKNRVGAALGSPGRRDRDGGCENEGAGGKTPARTPPRSRGRRGTNERSSAASKSLSSQRPSAGSLVDRHIEAIVERRAEQRPTVSGNWHA